MLVSKHIQKTLYRGTHGLWFLMKYANKGTHGLWLLMRYGNKEL